MLSEAPHLLVLVLPDARQLLHRGHHDLQLTYALDVLVRLMATRVTLSGLFLQHLVHRGKLHLQLLNYIFVISTESLLATDEVCGLLLSCLQLTS